MARRFVVVGLLGFLVQLAVFAALMAAGWSWLAATVIAVESAIAHNFVWHRAWTWRNRAAGARSSSWATEFIKFNAGTAITSVAGNAGAMAVLLRTTRVTPLAANAIAVCAMSAVNFILADRWVFRRGAPSSARAPRTRATGAVTGLAVLGIASTAAAGPNAAAIASWNKYVTETEARLDRDRLQPGHCPPAVQANGDSMDVESGTITHWRGAVFIPDSSLDHLLDRLQNPGTPPPQEDVVRSRVLARSDNSLSVYLRLVRHAIVTVSYDTDHDMTFRRWSPTLATARSVATRIDEVGGDDHGFLWRLNSYWRYEQLEHGMLVSLESLTLSRDVPWIIKPIAGPIASSIARESMVRTLEALKRYLSTSLG